jgi:hypothetical protein
LAILIQLGDTNMGLNLVGGPILPAIRPFRGLAPAYWPRTFESARDLDPHDLVQASCKQGFRDTIITLVNRPQGYVAAIMFAALIPLRLDPDKEESPSHIANAFPPP